MVLKFSDAVTGLVACGFSMVCAAPIAIAHDNEPESTTTRPEYRAPGPRGGQSSAWEFDGFEGEPSGEFSQDEFETIMLFLRENRPEMAQRLEQVRAANPQRAREVFTKLRRKFKHMKKVKQQDPEMFRLQMKNGQLEYQAKELGKRIRKQTSDTMDPYEAKEMKDELRQLIRQHFQVRQEMREMALQRLERRLEGLRNQLATRRASQERLVEQRYRELMAEEDLAEW